MEASGPGAIVARDEYSIFSVVKSFGARRRAGRGAIRKVAPGARDIPPLAPCLCRSVPRSRRSCTGHPPQTGDVDARGGHGEGRGQNLLGRASEYCFRRAYTRRPDPIPGAGRVHETTTRPPRQGLSP